MQDTKQLILASGSPRRRQLLQDMGLEFDIHVTDIDESRLNSEPPSDFALRLAQDKAKTAFKHLGLKHAVVLAADTIVVQGDSVFGKPKDFQDACQMWQRLSDSKHTVMTAICLMSQSGSDSRLVATEVEFAQIENRQMQDYWESGEPQDKAGAYAIQGLGSAWVNRINGSYSNVVGLPLKEVNELLVSYDLNWL